MNAIALFALALGLSLLGPGKSAPKRRRAAVRPAWRLPAVAVLGVGALAGIEFGPRGLVVVLVGAPFIARWVARTAVPARAPDWTARDGVPLVLDLMAAALRAGAPTSTALAAITPAAPLALRGALVRTAALLQLGASPAEAWGGLRSHPVLGAVARVATRSADSGIRLAEGLERQAVEVRAELGAARTARAHRVATLALLPLGLCFLPAFVCVGIVPIVVGVAGDAFATITNVQ